MKHCLLLLTMAAFSSGCTQLALFTTLSTTKKPPTVLEASADNPVVEVICMWEAAEGRDMQGMPCRGFAGQVMFFTPGHPQPVRVRGDVSVHVYDDQNPASDEPTEVVFFEFDDPHWNHFLRDSNLGPSYQMFIPYTRKGYHAANCSLRLTFTPADGGHPFHSSMVHVGLPGRRKDGSKLPRGNELARASQSQLLPEGNSVHAPVMSPARAEPGRAMEFSPAASTQMRQQMQMLQAVAARSTPYVDEPQTVLPVAAQTTTDLPMTGQAMAGVAADQGEPVDVTIDERPANQSRGYRLTR